ncbi:MAG: hypothetical protein ACK53Y_17350 [bacterium]
MRALTAWPACALLLTPPPPSSPRREARDFRGLEFGASWRDRLLGQANPRSSESLHRPPRCALSHL